jgi:hypothetical protein
MFGDDENLLFLRGAQALGFGAFLFIPVVYNSKLLIGTKHLGNTALQIFWLAFFGLIVIEFVNARIYLLNIIYPIGFISMSLLAYYSKPKPGPYALVAFLVFAYFFSKFITVTPASEWVKGSRNFVSVICIYVTTIPMLFSLRRNDAYSKLQLFVLLPLLALIFSTLAIGRSGILSTFILFFGSTFLFMKHSNRISKFQKRFVLVSVILVFAYVLSSSLDYLMEAFLYKFEDRGVDLEGRGTVIKDYLSGLTFRTLFFSYESLDFIFSQRNLTLHNSFLNWHYSYGFVGVIILFKTILILFKSLRSQLYFSLILFIICLRSFTDQVLFSDGILLGFPFLYAILCIDFNLKERKRNKMIQNTAP